jgi:predicted PurR-regulated permease PerM
LLAIPLVIAVVAALYFARDVIIPITLAVLLSFLLAPAIRWLHHLRVARVPAVAFTVLVAFLVILGFGAIVVQEVSSLARDLPNYQYNLETKIRALPGFLPGGGFLNRATSMLRDLRKELTNTETQALSGQRTGANGQEAHETAKPLPVQITQPEPQPLQIVESIVGPLLQPLATTGLVVIFVILILLEREDLRDRLLRLAGRGDLQRTTEAMDDAAKRVSRYLRSQLIVNTCVGVPIGLGLTAIGIPNAALWGIMTVVLRFIPYLGIIIAAAFPLALAIAVDPGWSLLLWTILLFVAIELVVAYIVEPLVYGDSTGVSPVALIAAATFWTWLWGPIGLLLSTPLTVCLIVLGRHVPPLRFLDVMLGNEPVLSPQETFYQRLLANDPEEATQQAEEFAEKHSLADFFDEVAIPVLARAQADSDRGALSPERRNAITQGFRVMLENLSDALPDEMNATTMQPAITDVEPTPAIVCIAGRNEIDETAALCLAHLLNSHSHTEAVQVLSAEALASDNHHLRANPLRSTTVVCLSLISTNSPPRARYLVRRVRRRAPQARVIIGFWGSGLGGLSAEQARVSTAADVVTSSLRDAIEMMATIATETAPAPVV